MLIVSDVSSRLKTCYRTLNELCLSLPPADKDGEKAKDGKFLMENSDLMDMEDEEPKVDPPKDMREVCVVLLSGPWCSVPYGILLCVL